MGVQGALKFMWKDAQRLDPDLSKSYSESEFQTCQISGLRRRSLHSMQAIHIGIPAMADCACAWNSLSSTFNRSRGSDCSI